MFGLLNIDKPPGCSSRQVVDCVDWLIQPLRSGHAGTLDPLATGVLVVCIGQATRLIPYVQQQPKRYTATFLLGRTSESDDTERAVTELPSAPRPTAAELAALLPQFTGTIQQQPPAFSALKVRGRRAYKLARRGHAVDLAPRDVVVHELRIVRYEYPELVLDLACSAGTYVRALGRDLARAAGTEAVMSALVRTAVGDFVLSQAVPLASLNRETLPQHLLSPLTALSALPKVVVSEEQLASLGRGQTIELPADFGRQREPAEVSELQKRAEPIDESAIVVPSGPTEAIEPGEMAAVDAQGRLRAILVPRGLGHYGPSRNFAVDDAV